MKPSFLTASLLTALPLLTLQADVTVPALFSDHMVLKKAAKVPLWGKADPGEEVTVTLGDQTAKSTAKPDGTWQLTLDLAKSEPGPFEMTVAGKNQIKISDVVVGEVWIASGQSNMEWVLKNTTGAEQEITQSANPMLRQFTIKKRTSDQPLTEIEGTWTVADPKNSPTFTAVGYFFGKRLQNTLNVPVGIINSSWGGTPSEAWTDRASLDSVPDLKEAKERVTNHFVHHPADQKKWAAAFGDWLKQTGREDRPVADATPFAAPDASLEGWNHVTLPGVVTGPDLPGTGAVWLRTDINRTEPATKNLNIDLGAVEGFDSVYWNGELLTSLNYKDYPGTGYARRYDKYSVPASKVKVGKNTLALRLFAPVNPPKLPTAPRLDNLILTDGWIAKQEFSLPTLTKEQLAAAPKPPFNPPRPQNVPTHLFNAMINPLIPYAISGVIWYQGENNAGRAFQYRTAFPLMITGWRSAWKQGDFPFYFCQLANFQPKKDAPVESAWAELREAQSQTLSLPNTAQAVLIDIGEASDIHPRNKKDAGERLARAALARDYGKKLPYSGPTFKSQKVENGKIRLTFGNAEGGLVAQPVPATYDLTTADHQTAPTVRNSPHSELEGFAICGEDRKWVWADAKIDGSDVLVWSDKVPAPVAVRYAWADNPTVNLTNTAGLPASPFRTDDFPASTEKNKL